MATRQWDRLRQGNEELVMQLELLRTRDCWSKSLGLYLPALSLALATAITVWGASSENWLDAPLDAGSEARGGYELFDSCRAMNRPCGQEQTGDKEIAKRKHPTIKLKKTTPRKILDLIVGRYPSHRWVVQDGVLVLEPKRRKGEDILARRLDHVSIRDSLSLKAAFDVFRQAKIPGVGISMTGDPRYACIDLELSNVTVRDALNAIAKADGQVMWSFVPRGPGENGPSIYLLSWGRADRVGLAHEKVGFINVEDPKYRGSCRDLKKCFR